MDSARGLNIKKMGDSCKSNQNSKIKVENH